MDDNRFVSINAALLAKQTQELQALNENVKRLSAAIDTRPTRDELTSRRRRNIAFMAGGTALLFFILGSIFVNQDRIADACRDRNANTLTFRNFLEKITAEFDANEDPESIEFRKAFTDYQNSLIKIKC